MSCPGNDLVYRAHADDLAACLRVRRCWLRKELFDRLAGAEKLPGQVDVDHGLPLVERHLGYSCITLQAGIGDQNIQPTERVDERRKHGLHVALFGHVGLQDDCMAAGLLDMPGELFSAFSAVEIIDSHLRARLRQCNRGCGSDPRAPSGNERGLTGKRGRTI